MSKEQIDKICQKFDTQVFTLFSKEIQAYSDTVTVSAPVNGYSHYDATVTNNNTQKVSYIEIKSRDYNSTDLATYYIVKQKVDNLKRLGSENVFVAFLFLDCFYLLNINGLEFETKTVWSKSKAGTETKYVENYVIDPRKHGGKLYSYRATTPNEVYKLQAEWKKMKMQAKK